MKSTNVKSLDLWPFPLRGGGKIKSTGNFTLRLTHSCHPELVSGSGQCGEEKLNRKIQQIIPRRINKLFPYLLLKRHVGQMLNRVQHDSIRKTRVGFTMAEILLSLTIIGVVAAITLPSLTGNINERTWNTQRKALYARFSQALTLMPSLNGYGTLDDTTDTAAETFITDGLSKVLKINNICNADNLADCGITSKFTNLKGEVISPFPATLADLNSMFSGSHINSTNGAKYTYNQTNTQAAAFETQNGESIVVYYNPRCGFHSKTLSSTAEYTQPTMCANFVFDLNGNKGPNTFGKDMGAITAIYPTDTVVVAPLPLAQDAPKDTQINAGRLCKQLDSESRLPNIEEFSSLFFNRMLWGMEDGTKSYWSSTLVSPTTAYYMGFAPGDRVVQERTNKNPTIRCIKR